MPYRKVAILSNKVLTSFASFVDGEKCKAINISFTMQPIYSEYKSGSKRSAVMCGLC